MILAIHAHHVRLPPWNEVMATTEVHLLRQARTGSGAHQPPPSASSTVPSLQPARGSHRAGSWRFYTGEGRFRTGEKKLRRGRGAGLPRSIAVEMQCRTMRWRVGLRRNFASCGKRGFMENGEVWVVQEGEVQRGCGGERRECRLCSMGEV
jgi:hypothetical protein